MSAKQSDDNRSPRQVIAGSATFAAAALLLTSAVVTILQGISALSVDQLLVISSDYVYRFNTTAWGWLLIVLGVLLAVVAFGLFWGTTWARVAAIILAALSIVAMFMWLPYYPVWSIVAIALDIIVIWAVATWKNPRAGIDE
ncbi:MAG TPA: hypothetical protein VMU34_24465 [Mycobacterium sp.]|nr:hypothetical protein [Mycobacterium sp.]